MPRRAVARSQPAAFGAWPAPTLALTASSSAPHATRRGVSRNVDTQRGHRPACAISASSLSLVEAPRLQLAVERRRRRHQHRPRQVDRFERDAAIRAGVAECDAEFRRRMRRERFAARRLAGLGAASSARDGRRARGESHDRTSRRHAPRRERFRASATCGTRGFGHASERRLQVVKDRQQRTVTADMRDDRGEIGAHASMHWRTSDKSVFWYIDTHLKLWRSQSKACILVTRFQNRITRRCKSP